jgi:MFS family permease
LYGALVLVAVVLGVIAAFPGHKWVVIGAVIAFGSVVGVNNTLVTTAVMSIAPVPRNVASASYGFVRFIGGGLAPYVAGKLVEHVNVHVPFLLGSLAALAAVALLTTVHGALEQADADHLAPVLPDAEDAEVFVPDEVDMTARSSVADIASR